MLIKSNVYLSLLFLIFLSSYSLAAGMEAIIVNVSVNEVSKGDFFISLTEERDFWVRGKDLTEMGIERFSGESREMDGEIYYLLQSISGLQVTFDEQNLLLKIMAHPSLLGKQIIDFASTSDQGVEYTIGRSGFLNYRIDYMLSDASEIERLSLTHQLGIHYDGILFLTDSVYSKDGEQPTWTRLMSHFTYDRREARDRFIVGDFFATSGELGSNLNLGGISYSKRYAVDPYFIKHPQIEFAGTAALPTELEVYLDGVPIRRERLSPGEFELKNISSHTGAGLLEVVLRDPFGREERIQNPFYLADAFLKVGLHDYSYHFGFLRERFGEESADYGEWVFSASHKYGVQDRLTAGVHLDASRRRSHIGPSLSTLLGERGVIGLAFSASHDQEEGAGGAGLFNYTYQGREVSGRAHLKYYTPAFAIIPAVASAERTKIEGAVGVGYGNRELGSLNADYRTIQRWENGKETRIGASYSRIVARDITVFVTLQRIVGTDRSTDFFVGLQYYPGRDFSLSTRYQHGSGSNAQMVQIQKNAPVGEGFGGRALFGRTDTELGTTQTAETSIQYNWKYGIYTAEHRRLETEQTSFFSAAGGVAYVGGKIGLSRPITDSFGLVQVEGLEGIRVYHNNQEVGRTDKDGTLFIPNLSSYYTNQVSIGDRDIPLNYAVKGINQRIAPSLRSGALIQFEVSVFQAGTGRIHLLTEGEKKPLEFYEMRLKGNGLETEFPTGKGGEFYIENIPPGFYQLSIDLTGNDLTGKICSFDLEIPKSNETFIQLGDFLCEMDQ
jgi:outer membrane usher protein FimD/PapC